MDYIINVKIHEKGPWEKIKGEDMPTGTPDMKEATRYANGYAQILANKTGAEVRWEFVGIGQGHYIRPIKEGAIDLSLDEV